ncbi:MAG: hypothetical protein IKM46_03680 [Clostridia bacterium]|nr:hypothetical protein [Clostridia bacterium]
MMSYEESVAEIRRRKAAILQKKKSRIKKLTVVLTSLVLCIGIGAVSWMFGSDRKDAPNKPPKVTHGYAVNESTDTDDIYTSDTEENSVPTESVTESEDPTESESRTPETEDPTESTDITPVTPPPTSVTGDVTYDEYSNTPEEDPQTPSEPQTPDNKTPDCEPQTPDNETPDLDIDYDETPSDGEKEKYRDFYYVNEYDYYFEDESVFYDGTYPLPINSYKHSFDEDVVNEGWETWFREYIMKLYGNEYDPGEIGSNYYETDDEYVARSDSWPAGYDAPRRINYNTANTLINISLDIGAVDGYFDLNPTEALDYVKNLKYYTAAIAHLGIADPYIEMWESYLDYSHSYWFYVYEKSDYLNLSKRTSDKGCFSVFLSFSDYEGDENDRVSARVRVYKPRDTSVTSQANMVTYQTALNYILGRFDYGDEFEYVKNNIKCIPHYTAHRQRDTLTTVYSFYVEYYDENGNKYYEYLGDCSMFDSETAVDTEVTEKVPSDGEVVRPTAGPTISDQKYDDLHYVSLHYSYESFVDEVLNSDKEKLEKITEIEKKYLYDTSKKTFVSDDEIVNGIFGNFRNNILDSSRYMIPFINGKSVCGEYINYTRMNLYSSYESSRKPCILFMTSDSNQSIISIYTTYMDQSIAKEAAVKGGPWATSVMFPGLATTDNYKQYYPKDELEYTTVYEKEYTVGDRKVLALVTEIALDSDPTLMIYFTYDDVFVSIRLNESIAEEILAGFELYECDLTTGQPLRDTPGRSEDFLN